MSRSSAAGVAPDESVQLQEVPGKVLLGVVDVFAGSKEGNRCCSVGCHGFKCGVGGGKIKALNLLRPVRDVKGRS